MVRVSPKEMSGLRVSLGIGVGQQRRGDHSPTTFDTASTLPSSTFGEMTTQASTMNTNILSSQISTPCVFGQSGDQIHPKHLLDGRLPVLELDFYPGLFKDISGQMHDLRPHEARSLYAYVKDRKNIPGIKDDEKVIFKPTIRNFEALPLHFLQLLLLQAYNAQLNILQKKIEETAIDVDGEQEGNAFG